MFFREPTRQQCEVFEYPLQEVMAISTGPLGTFEQLECGHTVEQPRHHETNRNFHVRKRRRPRNARRRCRQCPKVESRTGGQELLAMVRGIGK